METNEVRSQEWVDKIEILVRRAQSLSDPEARAVAVDLLEAVLQFHAAGLEQILEIVAQSGDLGAAMIAQMTGSNLIGSMLLLHDLHPDDLETRLDRALGTLQEMFTSLGAKLSLLALEPGIVRLQFDSPRVWSGSPVRASIENAIFQAAPEIESVLIEGLKEAPPANFVPVSDLLPVSGFSGSGL